MRREQLWGGGLLLVTFAGCGDDVDESLATGGAHSGGASSGGVTATTSGGRVGESGGASSSGGAARGGDASAVGGGSDGGVTDCCAGATAAGGDGAGAAGVPEKWDGTGAVRRTLAAGGGLACWVDGALVRCEEANWSGVPCASGEGGAGGASGDSLLVCDPSVNGSAAYHFDLADVVDLAIADARQGTNLLGRFGCAVQASGALWCWGNDHLGDEQVHSLRPIDGFDDVVQVSAGTYHACVLRRDRSVWCWGYLSTDEDPAHLLSTPQRVFGATTANQVSAGWGSACAALLDGSVQCLGHVLLPPTSTSGTGGALNLAMQWRDSETPIALPGAVNVTEVVLHRYARGGAAAWTCLRYFDGRMNCWSDGGGAVGASLAAENVTAVTFSHDLNTFNHHSVFWLNGNGTVTCFGSDNVCSAQLSPREYEVGVTQLAGGLWRVCVQQADGVHCAE